MKIRLAFAMLIACFVTGVAPTVAGASMHDGHGRSLLHMPR
ncbi:MAG: hypothetical protein ACXWZP_03150 [Gaiellaceae bacterium]